MAGDKYQALWLSHSSIADFLKCPRLYFLRNVYRDPISGHKITLTSPALTLGGLIHQCIESLKEYKANERNVKSLQSLFIKLWDDVRGEKGGFGTVNLEDEYRQRGLAILKKVEANPRVLLKPALRLKSDGLPYYWFSQADNLILCGKVDWLEYLPKADGVHIIDFKTGLREEPEDSLQLPIYHLLVSHLQKRPILKSSYWYLNSDRFLKQPAPDLVKAQKTIFEIAKRIKLGRQINYFKCPTNGCFACRPYERLLRGEGRCVSLSQYRQDIYYLPD